MFGLGINFYAEGFFSYALFFRASPPPPSRHAGAMVSGVMRMVFLFMLLDSLFMHTWLIFMPTWLFPMRTWLFLMRTPPSPPPSLFPYSPLPSPLPHIVVVVFGIALCLYGRSRRVSRVPCHGRPQ